MALVAQAEAAAVSAQAASACNAGFVAQAQEAPITASEISMAVESAEVKAAAPTAAQAGAPVTEATQSTRGCKRTSEMASLSAGGSGCLGSADGGSVPTSSLAQDLCHKAPATRPSDPPARFVESPSDGAVRKLLSKVRGSLEQALSADTLDWSSRSLKAEDAEVVAYVVRGNGSLTSLDCCSNSITGDAAQQLAEAVLRHPTLKTFCRIPLNELRADKLTTLDLGKNANIGVPGALVLAELLRTLDGSLMEVVLDSSGSSKGV